MESCDTWLLTLSIVSAFLLTSCTTRATADAASDPESWDIAVVGGKDIHFFYKNGWETGYSTVVNKTEITELTALAYDSANRTLYMSDWDYTSGFSSLLYSHDSVEENLIPKPMLDRRDDIRRISSMVFDPVSNTLFWIDDQLERLMKMEVASTNPEKLHDLKGKSPYKIALDIRNRFIYWTNWDSLERSRLNGTDRRVIIFEEEFKFSGLAVDHHGGKLYFASMNYNNHTYKIEKSNLDGTDRKVLRLVSDTHLHMPDHMVVDDTAVYWIDHFTNSIWKMYKSGTAKGEIKYSFTSYMGRGPRGIITQYNVGDTCSGSGCSQWEKSDLPRLYFPQTVLYAGLYIFCIVLLCTACLFTGLLLCTKLLCTNQIFAVRNRTKPGVYSWRKVTTATEG